MERETSNEDELIKVELEIPRSQLAIKRVEEDRNQIKKIEAKDTKEYSSEAHRKHIERLIEQARAKTKNAPKPTKMQKTWVAIGLGLIVLALISLLMFSIASTTIIAVIGLSLIVLTTMVRA